MKMIKKRIKGIFSCIINVFEKDYFKNSNCYKHAINELRILGYKPIDEEEDGPNKWIQENLLELLKVFYNQGHSGFSASYCIDAFKKLASFELLTPLYCDHKEFNDTGYCFQNKRLSSVFKKTKQSRPYYLNAIVFREENGDCFTAGNIQGINSSQHIKRFPFVPKTFYIDVISWEVDKETGDPKVGTGWWEHKIKDWNQLDEVFDYYDCYNIYDHIIG